MKSLKELKSNLEIAIQQNLSNMKLVQYIIKALSNKGINTNFIYEIFNEEIELDELTQIELIGLTKYMCEYLNDSKLNIDSYISKEEKSQFENFSVTKTNDLQTIVIDNVRKISNVEFECYLTYKKLYELRKNRLVGYNKDMQRASKIVKSKGRIVKKINANREGIKDLTNRFINQDIKTTTIHLTPMLKEGKNPLFKFNDYIKKEIFGEIQYKPVFDIDSENYCPCYITDGYHRYTACADAFISHLEKTGQELDGGLNVLIQLMDIDEGRKFVSDVFKRSDTDNEWTEALTIKNDSVVNDLIKRVNVLKDSMANTYTECVQYNKLTYKTLIDDALNMTGEDFNNVASSYFYVEKISKILNIITNMLVYKDVDISRGYIVGLIAIADKYKDLSENKDEIIKLACKIISVDEQLQHLNLKTKNINVKNIYKSFIDLV